MNSRITSQFRQAFGNLPENVQQQTREAYRQFKLDPNHPSLRFKKYIQNYLFILQESAEAIEPLDS